MSKRVISRLECVICLDRDEFSDRLSGGVLYDDWQSPNVEPKGFGPNDLDAAQTWGRETVESLGTGPNREAYTFFVRALGPRGGVICYM